MELLKFTHRTAAEEKWLKGVELFSRLNDRQIRKLARLLLPRPYSKGQTLIQKGDTGLGMFLIVSGHVEVFDVQGGARVSLAKLGPGQCVGEMSLIDDRPRSANVDAVEDAVCFLMTRDSFNGLTKRDPEVLWGIVPLIVERLRHADARLAEVASRAAAVPLAGQNQTTAEPGAGRPDGVVGDGASARLPDGEGAVPTGQGLGPRGHETDAEDEATERTREASVLSAMTELSTAAFLFSSSIFLLGAQEALRLLWERDSIGRSLRKNERVINSLTSRIQGNMSETSKQLLGAVQEPWTSIISLFDR